jgi:exonuclease SbcD
MRILHTSDWHIGHTFYGRKRYAEFEAFLDWTIKTICEEKVEVLLVAGDIFDTTTPSHRSQELYYRFLCALADSPCRHAVLIGGNHDSPTFLNAPKDLLQALHVHVIGEALEKPEDELLLLRDKSGALELIVCGVPYLRDRDLRIAEAGESSLDKEKKLVEGIRAHYRAVLKSAKALRTESRPQIPIVAMGHLFASGGSISEGDGVKELYIGSLAHVPLDVFPDCIDYLALGHLHIPQVVGGKDNFRYSGSPVAMSFKEALKKKSICIVDMEDREVSVRCVDVPVFQRLCQVRGNIEEISAALRGLAENDKGAWIDITFDGEELISDLKDRIKAEAAELELTIVNIKNNRIIERAMEQAEEGESLGSLSEEEVFERCMEIHKIPGEQRPALRRTYLETLKSLREEDLAAT